MDHEQEVMPERILTGIFLSLTDYPVTYQIEKSFRDHLYDLELETGETLSLFVYSKIDWNTRHHITPYFQSVSSQGIQL